MAYEFKICRSCTFFTETDLNGDGYCHLFKTIYVNAFSLACEYFEQDSHEVLRID